MAVFARTLYRSRLYIELLRSGQRSIDACPASAPFRPLQRGDRVNISAIKSANVDLVCEIVDKRHYKDLNELIAAEGVERCLGVRTNASGKAGGREGNAVRVLSPHGLPVEPHEFEQFGVFAFHLRVVEDVFASCSDSHSQRVARFHELRQIADGVKTIDARIVALHHRIVCVGDRLLFRYVDEKAPGEEWQVQCEAIAVKRYASFRELLVAEGVERCVPGGVDLETAIKACYRPNRNRVRVQREKENGVIAIHIKVISALEKVAVASGEEKKMRS